MDLDAGARHALDVGVLRLRPGVLLIALSFGTTDALGNPRFGSTLDNIVGIFNPTYLRVITPPTCG